MSYLNHHIRYAALLILFCGLTGCATQAGLSPGTTGNEYLEPVRGHACDVDVPDTLDLAERARLAISVMVSQPDKMIGGGACLAKMFESLPLLRTMSGSNRLLGLENEYLETMIFSQIDDDGLHYIGGDSFPIKTDDYSDTGQSYPNGPFSCILSTGRLMQSLNYYYQMTGRQEYRYYLEKMAAGLARITLTRGDYAYYPTTPVYVEPGKRFQEPFSYFRKGGWQNSDEPKGLLLEAPHHTDPDFRNGSINDGHWHDGRFGVHMYMSAPIEGFLMWYRLSGDSEALDMAGRLVQFVTQPKFWDPVKGDDKSRGNLRAGYLGHLHGHLANLRAILEYASVTNDLSLKLFVREGYEYTRRFQAPRVGYFSEWTDFWSPSETCEIADMIALAIRLSDEGIGDYWEDVDQYVRNQFVEQQHTAGKPDTIGAFVLASTPVDIAADEVAACCTENGAQALYYAWEGIVRADGDMARVNLLLNRSSRLVDVDSYLPYEGKVILANKRARRMLVRIPLWVDMKEVRMTINGKPAGITWQDRRIFINAVKPLDKVVITFPMAYSEDTYWIQSKHFTYKFKGNTVVGVDPRPEPKPGRKPIYLRDHYRGDVAPLAERTRFVPEKLIRW